MSFIFNAVLLFIVFVIQSTLMEYLSIGNVKPDMILLVAVYAGLCSGKDRGIALGSIAGFIQDNMSTGILGINTFSKGIIGYVMGSMRESTLSENAMTQSFFIFLSSLFDGLFFLFVSGVFLQFGLDRWSHIKFTFYQAVYNVVVGHMIFLYLSKVEKRFYK